MSTYPNRQQKIPRQGAAPVRVQYSQARSGSGWILWTVLGIALIAAVTLVAWRIRFQDDLRAKEREVAAMLVAADQLIQSDREDEAEASMLKALNLQPGDVRCRAVLERIKTKRAMIHEKKSSASALAMAQAEKVSEDDISAAIDLYGAMRVDPAYTKEAQQTAAERVKELRSGSCTLRLPADWPEAAVLTVDAVTKTPKDGMITGISPGKRTIVATRYGFRDPQPVTIDFRGLAPVPLPSITWKPLGTKVYLVSRPTGAAVWQNGKNTGKVTPCSIDDVDDGKVDFLLKLAGYAFTPVTGEVKDRKPLRLSVTLEPEDGSPPDDKKD